jgi:hypothetical protein
MVIRGRRLGAAVSVGDSVGANVTAWDNQSPQDTLTIIKNCYNSSTTIRCKYWYYAE